MTNASAMLKATENGAIKAIENLINEYAERGLTCLDMNDDDKSYLLFNRQVQDYFIKNGYDVNRGIISWDVGNVEEEQ